MLETVHARVLNDLVDSVTLVDEKILHRTYIELRGAEEAFFKKKSRIN